MKQVVQDIRSGATEVRALPDPISAPGHVVAAVAASLISSGTERYVVDLARKSLLGKARERPDHVRRVLQKVMQEGVLLTAQQVQAKLDEPMPLGYSAAGVVLECGRGVQELKVGDRIAMVAPHAGVVSVGKNLCARIPDNVSYEQAAYTSVAAIALEGVRLAKVSLGDRVLVIGLGLIGQITVALLKAHGCKVFGTDLDPSRLTLAREMGADVVATDDVRAAAKSFSDGHGVDAVLITAATASNQPIELAAEVARVRGRIVLVGVAGLNIPRPPFFAKELEFTVSSSLGPGRMDPVYEEHGVDYPIGYARWTAQRNMQAVLDTIATGRLPVERLTTHRIPIERGGEAFDLITSGTPHLGIILDYPPPPPTPSRVLPLPTRRRAAKPDDVGVGFIGAGNFSRLIMLPLLGKLAGVNFRGLASAKGMNAERSARKFGFEYATTDVNALLSDDDTSAIFIVTRHDLHAELVMASLRAGKHVFVEKPLCIHARELEAIDKCVRDLGDRCPVLMVGFNRRFSRGMQVVRDFFGKTTPLSISYRFAPGPLPPNSWPQLEDVGGGRIVGEACHAIDACVAIANSAPVRVFAESVGRVSGLETTDDRVFITMRHENGSISNVSYQAGGDKAAPPERVEIHGGGSTAYIDGWNEIELWRGDKRRAVSGQRDKGFVGEFAAFIDACRGGGAWPVSWPQLYGTTWASLMAVQSLRSGEPISRA